MHFLHIGKTGGSAIKAALAPVEAAGRFRIELHKHKTTMDDIPRGTPFFFGTRDPIERFVSGFYSRQRKGMPARVAQWTPEEEIAFTRFATPNELAEAIGTEPGDEAMHSIDHVRTSYWRWFGDAERFRARAGDIFFVTRQAHLVDDFSVLLGRLGLAGRVALPTDDIASHRNPPLLDRHLSSLATANLTRWYARDFEFMDLCNELRESVKP